MPHPAKLLTPDEVAKIIGVSYSTLERWRGERVGPPYIKLEKRKTRYNSTDLEVWLAGRTVATESASLPRPKA